MTRNPKSVAAFVEGSPFTEPQLRWWIFHAAENGLDKAGAVIRIGRRVYIDTDGFERWLTQQQQARA